MKEDCLKPLFKAARQVAAPQPPDNFPERVMSALKRVAEPVPLFDGLTVLFPRLAMVSVVLALLVVGVDYWSSNGSLSEFVAEATIARPDWTQLPLEL